MKSRLEFYFSNNIRLLNLSNDITELPNLSNENYNNVKHDVRNKYTLLSNEIYNNHKGGYSKLNSDVSKLGVKLDRVLRDNYFEEGKYWDSKIISLTKSDYENEK